MMYKRCNYKRGREEGREDAGYLPIVYVPIKKRVFGLKASA